MSLDLSKSGNKDYKKVPEGTWIALPVQVIDLGKQFKTDYKTGEKDLNDNGEEIIQHKVYISFEFPEHTDTFEDEVKPLWVGKEYTVSVHEKALLTSLLKATNPKAKNLSEIIGVPFSATVGLTSGGNPKIAACTSLPDKLVLNDEMVKKEDIKLFNEPKVYDRDDGENEVYSALPQFLRDKIDDQADKTKPVF